MTQFKNIFITGGAGYVGSALVPALLKKNYNISVYDLYLYGDIFSNLKSNPNLNQIKGDIRNKKKLIESAKNADAIIHLACISNDPSYELNPALGKSINYDAFFNILEAAKKNNVKRIIYASSSSVYGVKKEKNVTEETFPEPLTDYSKYKLECEKVLSNSNLNGLEYIIVRPATVCGYAPRLRIDLTVNILTMNALINKKIKIFGGKQLRPNINIKDMAQAYEILLEAPGKKINREIFNIGYQNRTVEDIAKIVKKVINDDSVEFEYLPTTDTRSYHINSDKMKRILNFEPKYTLENAVQSLVEVYNNSLIKEGLSNPLYHNIKLMQQVNLK